MRKYTFEVVIKEGSDEFWEGLEGNGIEEITKALKDLLEDGGWIHNEVKLKKYEETKNAY